MEIPIEIQVSIFLKDFKKIVTEGRGLDIVDRKENLKSLSQLGLTKRNCKYEILNLSVSDYYGGPKPDKDRPGMVWEFGKTIGGMRFILNLKLQKPNRKKLQNAFLSM